jgi:hypothetical protein
MIGRDVEEISRDLILKYYSVMYLKGLRTKKMSVRIVDAVAEIRIGRLLNASNMHYHLSYLFPRYLCVPYGSHNKQRLFP